jgi:hypothetical protein
MAEQLTNFGKTTLGTNITDSTTSVTVTDGSVFPATGNFRLNCEDELMLCTARSGNNLTVQRGAEGTTAAAHNSPATVTQVATAAAIETMLNERSTLNKLFAYKNFK